MSHTSNWPRDANGEPEGAAELIFEPDRTAFFNETLYLRSMGIPVLEQPSEEVPFTTVLFGESVRGGRLFVPESLLEDARYLLENPPGEELLNEELDLGDDVK